MSPEELDEARAKEAWRMWEKVKPSLSEDNDVALFAARLARENWTPPEPVDPDLLAFREWAEKMWPLCAGATRRGDIPDVLLRDTFLAGARMAREQFAPREREMLAVLEEFSRDCDGYLDGDGHPWALLQRARAIIAKYRGEA